VVANEDVERVKEGTLDVSNVGVWNDSFLRRRWCMRLYRFRKT
jgi:hypothetical protein